MSVKIRLSIVGKKHQLSYRVVATDTRNKRDGKFLEILGFYNPSLKDKAVKVDMEKYNAWLSRGAKPSPTVEKLVKNGRSS